MTSIKLAKSKRIWKIYLFCTKLDH